MISEKGEPKTKKKCCKYKESISDFLLEAAMRTGGINKNNKKKKVRKKKVNLP